MNNSGWVFIRVTQPEKQIFWGSWIWFKSSPDNAERVTILKPEAALCMINESLSDPINLYSWSLPMCNDEMMPCEYHSSDCEIAKSFQGIIQCIAQRMDTKSYLPFICIQSSCLHGKSNVYLFECSTYKMDFYDNVCDLMDWKSVHMNTNRLTYFILLCNRLKNRTEINLSNCWDAFIFHHDTGFSFLAKGHSAMQLILAFGICSDLSTWVSVIPDGSETPEDVLRELCT